MWSIKQIPNSPYYDLMGPAKTGKTSIIQAAYLTKELATEFAGYMNRPQPKIHFKDHYNKQEIDAGCRQLLLISLIVVTPFLTFIAGLLCQNVS